MMAEEGKHRRRRRRRRRRPASEQGEPRAPTAAQAQQAQGRSTLPDWQWRTFPVFFAFASGALFSFLLLVLRIPAVAVLALVLFGVAFGLAHIVTRRFVARRDR